MEGCWAEGAAGEELRRKLLGRPKSGLRVAAADNQIVALGTEPPWVEGAVFLGQEGRLYLPTLWQPELPLAWIEARLSQLGDPPWAMLPNGRVIGLSKARVMP